MDFSEEERNLAAQKTRAEFEQEWRVINRWIQKIQAEEGDEVIPDEVFEERLKMVADELFGTEA